MMVVIGCRKHDSQNSKRILEIDIKKVVKTWLNEQELKFSKEPDVISVKTNSETKNVTSQSNKLSNLILLKNSLDLENIVMERLRIGYNLIIIPISENVKTIKKLESSSTLNLILAVDNYGNVKQGRILYFIPREKNKAHLTKSSIINVLQDRTQPNDGEFKIMDITGNWVAQKEYKNRKLYSTGIISPKQGSNIQSTAICIEWYLTSTYYFPDGSIYTTTEYVGTTCSGCNSPEYMSLCPPEEGGSGSECNLSPEIALGFANATTTQSHAATLDDFSTGAEVIDPISGVISKSANLKPWRFLSATIHDYFISWQIDYSAYYNGRVYKTTSSSNWKWEYVTYQNFAQTFGIMPLCYGIDVTVTPGETEITDNGTKAKSYLSYTAICKVVCAFGLQVGQPDKDDNVPVYWGRAK